MQKHNHSVQHNAQTAELNKVKSIIALTRVEGVDGRMYTRCRVLWEVWQDVRRNKIDGAFRNAWFVQTATAVLWKKTKVELAQMVLRESEKWNPLGYDECRLMDWSQFVVYLKQLKWWNEMISSRNKQPRRHQLLNHPLQRAYKIARQCYNLASNRLSW